MPLQVNQVPTAQRVNVVLPTRQVNIILIRQPTSKSRRWLPDC